MTVLLVLGTFLAFILIDAVLNRKRVPAAQAVPATAQPAVALADGSVIEGFRVPENLRYHPGHTWLQSERRNVIRVGVDQFGAMLAGNIDSIELPKPGRWVRQGQKAWSLVRGAQKADMVSPVEGEVVEVNTELLKDPSLLRKDPYGNGWLMTVFAPDEESVSRNLLPIDVVRSWMERSVEKLYSFQPELAGATAADGGQPIDDLSAAIPNVSWEKLTNEFFVP